MLIHNRRVVKKFAAEIQKDNCLIRNASVKSNEDHIPQLTSKANLTMIN
jgi:hypothetical protein